MIDDKSVSRHHATLLHSGADWIVIDNDSANGTFVNGRSVARQNLQPGDIITFGSDVAYEFLLRPQTTRASSLLLLCLALHARGHDLSPRRFVLRRPVTTIGRRDTADLVISSPQVSTIHAQVVQRRGRPWVQDLGSLHGTHVNGRKINETMLRHGDHLTFGDIGFDVRLTPVPSRMGMFGLAAIALIAVGCLLAPPIWERIVTPAGLWTRDQYLEQAQRSLVSAISAIDRGNRTDLQLARTEFDIAIRSLVAAEYLPPDGVSDSAAGEALQKVARARGSPLAKRDVAAIYAGLDSRIALAEQQLSVADHPAPAPEAPAAQREIDTPGLTRAELTVELSWLLAHFGINTVESPIPEGLLTVVERYVDYWTGPEREYTRQSLSRSRQYLGMIEQELVRYRLPTALSYLPFVESGYRSAGTSVAGARGIWQFMPATASRYHLRVDDHVDERLDPQKSTVAACEYLRDLLVVYGPAQFMSALAAYNMGEYGMIDCLRGGDIWSQWHFWDAVERESARLPRETIEYVPKFLAAAVIMNNPKAFGFTEI